MDVGLVPAQLATSFPVARSQRRMVLSPQPVAKRVPSGLKARPSTLFPWGKAASFLVRACVPEAHVAVQRTSRDQAAVRAVGDPIALASPGKTLTAVRVATSQSRTVRSSDPTLASCFAVGAEGHVEGRITVPRSARRPAAPWQRPRAALPPSRLPEASSVPAGLKTARASPFQSPVGAVKIWRGWPVVKSQRVIMSSRVTEASWPPPGCQATEVTIFEYNDRAHVAARDHLSAAGHIPEANRAIPGRGRRAGPSGLKATS